MPRPCIDDTTGFDQWLSAGLKQQYQTVLCECLPRELTALIDNDDPPDAGAV